MVRKISGSVGRYGINRAIDVATVQELVNRVPIDEGGPVLPVPVDGFCGERTKSAIQVFQRIQFKPDDVDGRVDPCSPTFLSLLAFERTTTVKLQKSLPTTRFCIRRIGSEEFFEDRRREQFYEVTNLMKGSTAIYWMGFPPQPGAVPAEEFSGTPQSFQIALVGKGNDLECAATYTTRMKQGSPASQLTLRLSTGFVDIPMSTHLLKPRPAGTAILAGLFKKVRG